MIFLVTAKLAKPYAELVDIFCGNWIIDIVQTLLVWSKKSEKVLFKIVKSRHVSKVRHESVPSFYCIREKRFGEALSARQKFVKNGYWVIRKGVFYWW